MKWCVHDSVGKILMTGIAGDSLTEKDLEPCGGKPVLNVPDEVGHETHYYSNGVFKTFPIKPTQSHIWDWVSLSWKVNLAAAELAIKDERNKLLADTDWTQLPDVPEVTRKFWVEYRQALRDITEQVGYPLNISWPTKPS